jgi:hypothetical protein
MRQHCPAQEPTAANISTRWLLQPMRGFGTEVERVPRAPKHHQLRIGLRHQRPAPQGISQAVSATLTSGARVMADETLHHPAPGGAAGPVSDA